MPRYYIPKSEHAGTFSMVICLIGLACIGVRETKKFYAEIVQGNETVYERGTKELAEKPRWRFVGGTWVKSETSRTWPSAEVLELNDMMAQLPDEVN